MLRRDNDSVLRAATDLEMSGKKKRGMTKEDHEKTGEKRKREAWFKDIGCRESNDEGRWEYE